MSTTSYFLPRHAARLVTEVPNLEETVWNMAVEMLDGELCQGFETDSTLVDDAIAETFKKREQIADRLCRRNPAASSRSIDAAVADIVTLKNLQEMAGELVDPTPAPSITMKAPTAAADAVIYTDDMIPF